MTMCGRKAGISASWVAALVAMVAAVGARPALGGWQTFRSEHGLVGNLVTCVHEDRAGNLWFGTNADGVSRFDGVGWTAYTVADGLVSNNIKAILQDRSGSLWFATSGGVSRLDKGQWTNYTDSNGLPTRYVWSIAEDRAGNLWVGTHGGGASRFDGSTWTTYTQGLPSPIVYGVLGDRRGDVWFNTLNGVARFDGRDWYRYPDRIPGLVQSMFEDHLGRLYFTFSTGFIRFDGARWDTLWISNEGSGIAIAEDRSGDIWVGAFRCKGGGEPVRRYTTADGLISEAVTGIVQDRLGNMWFGTSGGVSRYDGSSWTTFNSVGAPGFAFTEATVLLEDHHGRVWASNGYSLWTYEERRGWYEFDYPYAHALLEDRGGNVWYSRNDEFGTGAGGVTRYDGVERRTYTVADGLASNQAEKLLEDRLGNIWCAGPGGVSRFDGTRWVAYTTASTGGQLVEGSFVAIAEDRSGSLWFATARNGVSRFDGREWRLFTVADGIPSAELSGMIADSSGHLWLGSRGGGVARYDGAVWRRFTAADGLSDDYVYAILQDNRGGLWIGTNDGVSVYDGASWSYYSRGSAIADVIGDIAGSVWYTTSLGGAGVVRYDGVRLRIFSTIDGLPNNYVRHIFTGPSGNLWFSCPEPLNPIARLTRHEPDRVPPRGVFLTGSPGVAASRAVTIPFVPAFGEENVEFSYSFDRGDSSAWSRANSWSSVNLADGVHRLEVRARDREDNVDPDPPVVSFEVDATPPVPVIASPASGEAVRDSVLVLGAAADPRFREYAIEFRAAGTESWGPPRGGLIARSSVERPGPRAVLGAWDTRSLADGSYELRVSVADTLGLAGVALVTVVIDNLPPYVAQTAPAKVSAASGGDIWTTNGEVHLYFPPHAFGEDAVVSIGPIESTDVPETLPNGARRLIAGYDLAWGTARLTKVATLDLLLTEIAAGRGLSLAIYASEGDSSWHRVGGTVEATAHRISVPLAGPGRYALFAESQGIATAVASLGLSLTPRVFSPAGGHGRAEVAINFTLARGGPVTVKIYNRSGRLVRTVADGMVMSPGANLLRWDGRDRDRSVVGDGVYLVAVEAVGQRATKLVAVVP